MWSYLLTKTMPPRLLLRVPLYVVLMGTLRICTSLSPHAVRSSRSPCPSHQRPAPHLCEIWHPQTKSCQWINFAEAPLFPAASLRMGCRKSFHFVHVQILCLLCGNQLNRDRFACAVAKARVWGRDIRMHEVIDSASMTFMFSISMFSVFFMKFDTTHSKSWCKW